MSAKLLSAKLGEAGGAEEGIVFIEIQIDAGAMASLMAPGSIGAADEASGSGLLAEMLEAPIQQAISQLEINAHKIQEVKIKLAITPSQGE